MKKIFNLVCLIFISIFLSACQNVSPILQEEITQPEASNEWILVQQIQKTQNSIYLQVASIQTHPANTNLRSFNLLLNQEAALPPSSIAHYTFDCKNKRYRLEGIDFYSDSMAQGELVKSVTASTPSFFPLSPKSYLLEATYPLVCGTD